MGRQQIVEHGYRPDQIATGEKEDNLLAKLERQRKDLNDLVLRLIEARDQLLGAAPKNAGEGKTFGVGIMALVDENAARLSDVRMQVNHLLSTIGI